MVVKNSLVRWVIVELLLVNVFVGVKGVNVVCWGGEDFIFLVKEVMEFDESEDFE